MTAEQIADRRAAIEDEQRRCEAELARRESWLLFLRPGVPLSPSELETLRLPHPKEKQ